MGANIENSDATYPLLSDLKSKFWRIIRLNQHHGTSPRHIGLSAIFPSHLAGNPGINFPNFRRILNAHTDNHFRSYSMRNHRTQYLLSGFLFILSLLALIGPLIVSTADAAPRRSRIGLVLGGGGARGIAHVGVLKMLEELRVPVDCVAGTSMGSIIGGLYASGMTPEQMNETVQRIDWPAAFADGPPRADLPFRTKQQQRVLLTDKGVGMKNGSVQLPQGLLQGQNLLLLLEELSLPATNVHDFDQLKIPYRAVATNLVTGTPVVLKSGQLAKAMRASMSIPSALAPVELEGKLLVDGGVSNNVPVDVVRELCRPDVIIAVDVGAPLAPASELTSILSITNQLTSILTVRNAQQQINTLGRKDILITPDLKDISSIDFNRAPEAVQIGYAAAESQRSALSRLSVSPNAYQADLAARPKLPDAYPVVDFIRIKNNTRLADQVIESQLGVKPGDRLDPQQLNRNLNVIYGMGDFQQVNYSLVEENGKTGLVVEAQESYIGANTLNFGIFLGANMKGDSLFNVSAAYTMTQLNSLGGQWRSFVQIGGNIELETDFYQPLDADQEYFIDPFLSYQQYDLDVQSDPDAESARPGSGSARSRRAWKWAAIWNAGGGCRWDCITTPAATISRLANPPPMKATSTTAATRSAGRRTRWTASISPLRAIWPTSATTAP